MFEFSSQQSSHADDAVILLCNEMTDQAADCNSIPKAVETLRY